MKYCILAWRNKKKQYDPGGPKRREVGGKANFTPSKIQKGDTRRRGRKLDKNLVSNTKEGGGNHDKGVET